MAANNYTYHRLEDQYLPGVQYLFWTVFNKKYSLQYIANKYNTEYLGVKYTCFIAFHDDKPVAFYGAIPQKFVSGDTEILVAHACDSFTLNEYQKQGLHYNLAIRSYELMKSLGIQFVYAFHSENTYFSTKKLGWKEHTAMQRFHLKPTVIPLAKLTAKLKLEHTYAKWVALFLKKYTASQITTGKNKFSQLLDDAFFDYKNSFNNHYLITLAGCVFWLKIDSIMRIGAFTSPSDENFKKAINKLKTIAAFLGITEILFQVSVNSKMYSDLCQIAAPKDSWRIGYLDFEAVDLNDFDFSYSDLDTF